MQLLHARRQLRRAACRAPARRPRPRNGRAWPVLRDLVQLDVGVASASSSARRPPAATAASPDASSRRQHSRQPSCRPRSSDDDGARCRRRRASSSSCEVAIAVERREHAALAWRRRSAATSSTSMRRRDRSVDERRRLGGRRARCNRCVDDLRVTGRAELTAQPLQLVPERVGHGTIEEPAERGQGAAQPSRGDSHLVHGVRRRPGRTCGSRRDELARPDRRGARRPRRRAVERLIELDGCRRVRSDVAERPWPSFDRPRRPARHRRRRAGAATPASSVAVAVDELDLDLPPGRDGAVGLQQRRPDDAVVGDLGQHVVVRSRRAGARMRRFSSLAIGTQAAPASARARRDAASASGHAVAGASRAGHGSPAARPTPTDSFRCQPSSSPPCRRRNATLPAARRRSEVS